MTAADLVAQLANAGTPPELLAAVAEALFTGEIERKALAARKENDRARKVRSREITGSHVTERDGTGQPVTPSSDKALPQTPSQITTIPSPPFKSPSSQRRGTRLANDFEVPEDWLIWAMSKRAWSREEAVDEAETFARYWQAKPGKDAVKLDWPKTWQNWVVNSRRANQQTAPPVGAWDGMA